MGGGADRQICCRFKSLAVADWCGARVKGKLLHFPTCILYSECFRLKGLMETTNSGIGPVLSGNAAVIIC